MNSTLHGTLTALALLLCFGAPSGPSRAGEVPEGFGGGDHGSLLRQAKELEQQRRWRTALSLYREAEILDPSHPGARLGMARVHLEQGRIDAAETALRPLLLRDPVPAEALRLHGRVLYRTERLEQARDALEASLDREPDSGARELLRKVQRELAWTGDYRDAPSSNFILRYEGETRSDEESALRRLLEQTHQDLRRRFAGAAPPHPIVVVLYPMEDFHEATLAPRRAIGLYDGKVRLPARGLDLSDPRFRGTLVHELTHAFLHGIGGEGVPRWLHEGLAEHMEGEWIKESERQLARAFAEGRGMQEARRFSYPRAQSFVEYLLDRGGMAGIQLLLDELSRGGTDEEALLRVYGRGHEALIRAWGASLVEEHL